MKKLLLSLSVLCLCITAYPQANGSFYMLQLGKKTCLFKYQEKADSTYAYTDSIHSTTTVTEINPATLKEGLKWVKDTLVIRKSLTLQDTSSKTVHTKSPLYTDTITSINAVTLEEEMRFSSPTDATYNVETYMTYSDFLILLKSKFELRNPQRNLRVYSFDIYFETADTSGNIHVIYPQSYEGVIASLNCLTKGGFLLFHPHGADHNEVGINTKADFLALIHIRN